MKAVRTKLWFGILVCVPTTLLGMWIVSPLFSFYIHAMNDVVGLKFFRQPNELISGWHFVKYQLYFDSVPALVHSTLAGLIAAAVTFRAYTGDRSATVARVTTWLYAIPMLAATMIDTVSLGPSATRVLGALAFVGGIQIGFALYVMATRGRRHVVPA